MGLITTAHEQASIPESGSSLDAGSREIVECIAYMCMFKSLLAATIESHLSAIKNIHQVERGIDMETVPPVVVRTYKGVGRCHTGFVTQPRLRRPLSWPMLRVGENLVPRRRQGGRVLWLALGVAYFFLMHALELFAETATRVHDTFCSRHEDVVFLLCRQVSPVAKVAHFKHRRT